MLIFLFSVASFSLLSEIYDARQKYYLYVLMQNIPTKCIYVLLFVHINAQNISLYHIKELAHRKQQKSQKMILPASHWLCVNVLLN